MKKHIYIYLLLIVLIGCKKEPKQYASKLEKSLELSGENRTELEKVLTHYSKNEKDSLKYKAAIFLIENMEGHSYRLIKSRKEWDEILGLSDSLIKIEHDDYETLIDSCYESYKIKYKLKKDLHQIKAKNLIENIDVAFNVWPRPWNSYLDFNDFCNYILPYRQKEEPLELTLRKKYYQENKQKISDTTSVESMIGIAKETSAFPYGYKYKRLIPFDQSLSDIEKGKMTDCVDASIYSSFKSRSIGIPMVIDFALWPNFRSSHYWNSVVYNKDSLLYADKDFFWGEPGSYRLRRKIAKIYRIMYASQGSFNNLQKRGKTWTFLDDSNIIDVTSQYIKTTNIKMKLRASEEKTFSMAYLCIFNDRKWRPIAKTTIKQNREVEFKAVGRGNIYTIFYIDGHKRIPASEAFSVNKDGRIYTHKANINNTRNVKLKRKTKLTNRIRDFGSKMAGGLFQLSNTADFKITKDMYHILINDTILIPRTINITDSKAYRYARYRSPINEPVQIAEMQWFSGKDIITGKPIGPKSSSLDEDVKKVFDGDDLTFFTQKKIENSHNWIGLDFGGEKKISKLRFAPRSDLNYIKPKDTYELVYWDNEWISIGKKLAEDYYIEFDNVPENALLWLRNLSEGLEEELFVYENEKQLFWNSSEY